MSRLATFASLLLFSAAVTADAAERRGFLIGFAIGGGALDCSGCPSSSGLAFSYHLGGPLTERVTLAADVFGVNNSGGFEQYSSYQLLALAQYWVSPRFWVGGGVGYGQDWTDIGNPSRFGPAKVAFAVLTGVELVQRGKFALDLRGRYGRTSSSPASDHLVALVGFTWY